MTTLLPKDADNNIIPALRLADGGAHQFVATSASAVNNTSAFSDETKVISMYATQPVYIKFGQVGVTATMADHFFPANTYYDIAISGGDAKGAHHDYISVLALSDDATIYISEKE